MQDNDLRRQQRREKIRKKKRLKLMFYGAVSLIVVVVLIIIIAVSNGGASDGSTADEAGDIGPPVPGEDATIAPLLLDYDYTKPVPESSDVNDSFFSDTLFVGDARFQCFELYSLFGNADILSGGGINVSNVMNYEFGRDDGVTTLGTLLSTKKYSIIYLMFGLNELGWESSDAFISSYELLINEIKARQPDAAIYINLIIPITSEKSGSPSYLSNERITIYNGLIKSMCAEKGIYFLDLAEVMCGSGTTLSAAYATDGIQFNLDGTTVWYNYIKTHIVAKEKYRN